MASRGSGEISTASSGEVGLEIGQPQKQNPLCCLQPRTIGAMRASSTPLARRDTLHYTLDGIVTLTSDDRLEPRTALPHASCRVVSARLLLPDIKCRCPDRAICVRRQKMPAWMEVTMDECVSGEEVLSLFRRFEPLHLPLSAPWVERLRLGLRHDAQHLLACLGNDATARKRQCGSRGSGGGEGASSKHVVTPPSASSPLHRLELEAIVPAPDPARRWGREVCRADQCGRIAQAAK